MLAAKTALAASVALAALSFTEGASAQKYRAAPRSYDAGYSRPTDGRFSPEEQRIIDQITANGWRNGK